jgi:hypothetical protein
MRSIKDLVVGNLLIPTGGQQPRGGSTGDGMPLNQFTKCRPIWAIETFRGHEAADYYITQWLA